MTIDYFIDGLDDQDIRMKLRETLPKDLDEAQQIAIKLESIQKAEKQRPISNRKGHVNQILMTAGTEEEASQLQEHGEDSSEEQMHVYNVGNRVRNTLWKQHGKPDIHLQKNMQTEGNQSKTIWAELKELKKLITTIMEKGGDKQPQGQDR